eukprot:2189237-Rhodomonas_salina.2
MLRRSVCHEADENDGELFCVELRLRVQTVPHAARARRECFARNDVDGTRDREGKGEEEKGRGRETVRQAGRDGRRQSWRGQEREREREESERARKRASERERE